MDSHNQSGLLNFGYTTNLTFLLTFSCPIFYIILVTTNFIKESVLLKKGLSDPKKQKKVFIAFVLMVVSFIIYTVAASLSAEIALTLLGITAVTLIISVTFFFAYAFLR
jgi:4-amino-4-deoxy-L-arabinose transferase-like glycosyltransferase